MPKFQDSSPVLLREHAERIWRAGVAAVDSHRLVAGHVNEDANELRFGDLRIGTDVFERIIVVGAGKAGAGMAAGFEAATAQLTVPICGWVNVPENCVRKLNQIHLHAARPAGVNEPTQAGVDGTREILKLVSQASERDLCVVLISGGGSALLPAPADGISLSDKLAVTRLLMHGGNTIEELNLVRTHLSAVKGGRLAQANRAGHMISLIISDVIGDPLSAIASGPTVPNNEPAEAALEVLAKYGDQVPEAVLEHLRSSKTSARDTVQFSCVHNQIIGNNRTAVNAAIKAAIDLGYDVRDGGSNNAGIAREVGAKLASQAAAARDAGTDRPLCFISGGEPTVELAVTDKPRRGGRNQELVLGAIASGIGFEKLAILSGGTDGEDGPTDAAGAIATSETVERVRAESLNPNDFLAINNAFEFFERTDSLLKTGPTHTNVMDLRVVLVGA